MLKEYHKIETPYKRDMEGSKKLIEGDFRSNAVKQFKDCKWIFTEKIDGTNIRVYWDGHSFSFHGRTDRAILPQDLVHRLEDLFNNDAMEQLVEQMFGEKEVILFGEGYGPGIQAVGKEYNVNSKDFIMFDVMVDGKYLNHSDMCGVATALNIPYSPVSLVGTIDDAVEFVKTNPVSKIGTCVIEGVVGRLPIDTYDGRGNRLIVKIKCADFEKSS
jgi:ATP-dependent RNA circularization protein (DNA/RNA ligase family)